MSAIATVRRRQRGEHEESYFISMTDMMVGLVFVLMVMLVYYALQYRQTTNDLTDTKIQRAKILQDIQERLKRQDVQVVIDTDSGVLRLPEDVLFDKGSDVVKPGGQEVLRKVGLAIQAEAPCYTAASPPPGCPSTKSGLESVFVEGHTDSDQLSGPRDNWNLSADRAVNTYRSMVRSDAGAHRHHRRPATARPPRAPVRRQRLWPHPPGRAGDERGQQAPEPPYRHPLQHGHALPGAVTSSPYPPEGGEVRAIARCVGERGWRRPRERYRTLPHPDPSHDPFGSRAPSFSHQGRRRLRRNRTRAHPLTDHAAPPGPALPQARGALLSARRLLHRPRAPCCAGGGHSRPR